MTETKPELNFNVLNAAHMASLRLIPCSDAVSEAVDDLLEQTVSFRKTQEPKSRMPKQKDLGTLRSTIEALVGDLLEASMNKKAEGWCWRLSDRNGFGNTRATTRHYDTLYKWWPLMNLMDVAKGFSVPEEFDGQPFRSKRATKARASRLRATPHLLRKLAECGITPESMALHFKRDWKTEEPIQLRASKLLGQSKGDRIKYTKTPYTDRLEQEVKEINQFLADWEYSHCAPPVLYRVFNDGNKVGYEWDRGGRFQTGKGGYLGLPKKVRNAMQINGEVTVQIDVSACQLTMLHGLFGLIFETGTDLYSIGEMDREEVKDIVNHIVGLGRLPKTGDSASRARVLARFPFLRDLEKRRWDTLSLQAIESNIMCRTLLTLKREHQIPALQVFDCLIVRQSDVQVSCDVFGQTFFNELGVWPTLHVE